MSSGEPASSRQPPNPTQTLGSDSSWAMSIRHTLLSINNLAGALQSQGKLEKAEPLFREALDRRRRTLGDTHRDTLASLSNLTRLLMTLRRFEEAEPLARELFERAAEAQIQPAQAGMFMARHGTCLVRLRRFDDAEAPLREAHRRLVEADQHKSPAMRDVLRSLAELCDQTDRADEAARWRDELSLLAQ